MKNILVLTSVYPAEDFAQSTTPVVHYFAREWVSQGYNVEVVHNARYYIRIVYPIISIFKNVILKFYNFTFRTEGQPKEKHYTLDRVNVHRLPIFKKLPLLSYSKKELIIHLRKIVKLIDSMDFNPDIIIGHWANPQLFLVSELAKHYKARTCVVIHSDVKVIGRIYKNNAPDIIRSIDVWGFRSKAIKESFEELYGRVSNSFLCYSGIPEINIKPLLRSYENEIKTFLFVGLLIPRKNPTTIIKALNKSYKNKNFHINFVGEGPEKKRIQLLAQDLGMESNISLLGRIPRDEVFEMMNKSDYFIMLSKPETLGLVYLEAMSMGCITIGSKDEGIDGIIQHGVNGFLCDAGDDVQLSVLLSTISKLSSEELISISKNAIRTVSELTDAKTAKQYLESVLR